MGGDRPYKGVCAGKGAATLLIISLAVLLFILESCVVMTSESYNYSSNRRFLLQRGYGWGRYYHPSEVGNVFKL